MRYISLIILVSYILVGCGTSTNAYLKSKNPNITWVDKDAVKKKREFPTEFGYQEDNNLFLYGYGGNSKIAFSFMGVGGVTKPKKFPIFYQVNKDNMTILKSSKEVDNEKLDYIDFIGWNSKGAWVLYTDNPNKKFKSFYAKPISLDKPEKSKHLFDIETERRSNFVQDGYGFNHDSSTITYTAEIYDGKNDRLSFFVQCFNFATMEKLWTHSYTFPHTVKKRNDIDDIEFFVNKNGEPQFLIKNYFTDRKKEKTKGSDGNMQANYNFKFYVLTKVGKIEEYTIDTKGSFINSIDFPNNKTTNPIVCAYTFTKNNFRELKGVIFKQINLDNKEVVDLKEIAFNTKNLSIYNEETGKKMKQSGSTDAASDLRIKKIIITENGDTYVLGEKNYVYQVCYNTSRGGTRCYYKVESGNILITKINKDGTESWSKIIPKSQDIVWPTSFHSFKAFAIEDKIHLFYNDHSKNYTDTKAKRIYTWGGHKTVLTHVIVNPDGKYELIEALGEKDHPAAVSINSIQKIDDDHIILFDTKTLGKLSIDR